MTEVAREIEVNAEDGSLTYPVWVKNGSMMVHRDCLDPDDPRQTYNYLKSYGIVPEEYGIFHPMTEMFDGWSREQLISEVVSLRKALESYARQFG